MLSWLWGSKPTEQEDARSNAPNYLVIAGEEIRIHEGAKNTYDFDPLGHPEQLRVYKADIPFAMAGVVAIYGIILPYFEIRVEMACSSSYIWAGFAEYGGVTFKGAKQYAEYDSFLEVKVGDVAGVGVNPKTRKLFLTLNGELFKSDVASVPDSVASQFPCVRLRGGNSRFSLNFGENEAFACSPYSICM